MKIHIPWIISRRKFLFAVFVDYFITSFFYYENFLRNYGSYPNPIVTSSISFFWIILSYILGRYMICRKINIIEISKTILKSLFIFICCNFIYLTINWSNKIFIFFYTDITQNLNFQNEQNIFFIKTTFLITIISCLVQYFLSILTNKIYSYKKQWLFYGSEESFTNFLKEIDLKNKFIFNRIKENCDIEKLNFEDVEGVIIDHNKEINKIILNQILFLKSKEIKVLNVLKWYENELHRIPPFFIDTRDQILEKFYLLDDSYKIRIKRIGDFTVSLFLLFITSPLFILTSLLIYFEDGGPIFYSQIRTGFNGKNIRIYKFRSMIINAEQFGPQWSTSGDKRITKVGKLIRALRIDELPQLLSVLEGNMSLIGPRPERPEIEKSFHNEIPFYEYRNIIKPGISGWAQVNFNYAASKEDTIKKLSYDIYYINHISFLLDILILIKTIKIIFHANSHKPK